IHYDSAQQNMLNRHAPQAVSSHHPISCRHYHGWHPPPSVASILSFPPESFARSEASPVPFFELHLKHLFFVRQLSSVPLQMPHMFLFYMTVHCSQNYFPYLTPILSRHRLSCL